MRALIAFVLMVVMAACGPGGRHGDDDNGNGADGGNNGGDGGNNSCVGGACSATCELANMNHSSVGCEYYAVDMDGAQGPPYDACYAVFVANVSTAPVHITVDMTGTPIDLSMYAKLPVGTGTSLTYGAYDPMAGLAPGGVAILFLDYGLSTLFDIGNVACPVPAALADGVQVHGTGLGNAFHITTDVPVVAYQELPYGGGAAAATGASLLIPTSAWQTNYIAVAAYDTAAPPIDVNVGGPSHDIVALMDNTTVTIRPLSAIAAGTGVAAGAANEPYTVMLDHGQYVQLTQSDPLSGSPVTSDQPIGVFGGHQIMGIDRCCGDHGEQMLTPVSALGSEYVAAPHGDRKTDGTPDPRIYRIYGAVDETQLTYEPAGTGPATVNEGEMLEIRTASDQTAGAFVVRSQDAQHPFAMFTYMSGAGDQDGGDGAGDPDFVRLVPPPQFLAHYVFFTDPTYPFTDLTIVRQQVMGVFADVKLDCMGTIPAGDWNPVGTSGTYEIAHEKIVDHWNAQNGCNNGVHVMDSAQPFGVWVWGWGTADTNTGWVSYGYPAGEAVLPINNVVIE